MTKSQLSNEEKPTKVPKPEDKASTGPQPAGEAHDLSGLAQLQNQVGNRAVQRLLAQRSGGEKPFELDEETTQRINQARGGGQPLEEGVQEQMGNTLGHDLSGVRVHTSPEADTLNHQLQAKAFTIGQDVFFREGAYQPHSSNGQELIAHELTHVVQQNRGAVHSEGGTTVNAPGDSFEKEADAVAKEAASINNNRAEVQRQALEDEEEIPPSEMEGEMEEEEEL